MIDLVRVVRQHFSILKAVAFATYKEWSVYRSHSIVSDIYFYPEDKACTVPAFMGGNIHCPGVHYDVLGGLLCRYYSLLAYKDFRSSQDVFAFA